MPSSHLPEEEKVEKDGYTLTFYPGFCSSASVRDQKGDHELFVQKETFHLPDGEKEPATRHKLRLKGGPNAQDVTLEIHDPHHRIARIRIELYEKPRRDDAPRDDDEPTEELEVMNAPKTCPPTCID